MVTLNIKNVLEKTGNTQYWLSKQTGIDAHNIKNLCEGNPKSINLSTIDKICTTLNCTPNDILIMNKDDSE